VRQVETGRCAKAGFDYTKALFCGVSKLFKTKYGEHINISEMPKLTFDMPNPFN
jgi:hypothetical protein